jgi:hypothetical protein
LPQEDALTFTTLYAAIGMAVYENIKTDASQRIYPQIAQIRISANSFFEAL